MPNNWINRIGEPRRDLGRRSVYSARPDAVPDTGEEAPARVSRQAAALIRWAQRQADYWGVCYSIECVQPRWSHCCTVIPGFIDNRDCPW